MKYTRLHKLHKISPEDFSLANLAERYLVGQNMSKLPDLYKAFGVGGPKNDRDSYITSLSIGSYSNKSYKAALDPKTDSDMFDRCESLARWYLNRLRSSRAETNRFKTRLSKVQIYLAGSGNGVSMETPTGEFRTFDSSTHIKRMVRHLNSWRGNHLNEVKVNVAQHSRNHDFTFSPAPTLTYTPHIARMRIMAGMNDGDAEAPIFASDRFILDYMLQGLPYVPSLISDGDVIPVRFIDGTLPFVVQNGFLAKVATEFACAATERDALKGAKMRAVRKTKKALGLL